MIETHFALLAIGGLLLAGLVADEVGRRTRLPRVTLLIMFDVIAGPSALDLIPASLSNSYEFLASIALTMVAFLLGGTLSKAKLSSNGKAILIVSLSIVILTAVLVFLGLIAIGTSTLLALLLAGIATATAPAATRDAVRQIRAKGDFTDTLLGVVAVDDAPAKLEPAALRYWELRTFHSSQATLAGTCPLRLLVWLIVGKRGMNA